MLLAHPNFICPFILSTDASLDSLEAILSQVPEGGTVARPIGFASKALTRAQANYPAHHLELSAPKWSICDTFSHWLKGHTFTVWSMQRWLAKLAAYNFSIKCIQGKKNIVADALSRPPFIQACLSKRLIAEPYGVLLKEAEYFREVCGPGHISHRGKLPD